MKQQLALQQEMDELNQALHKTKSIPAPPLPGHVIMPASASAAQPAPMPTPAPMPVPVQPTPATATATPVSTDAVDKLSDRLAALETLLEDVKSTSTRFFGRVAVPRSLVYVDYKDTSKPASKINAGDWVTLSYPLVRTQRPAPDKSTITDTWVRCYSINPTTLLTMAFWVNTTTNGAATFDSIQFYPH